MSAKVLSLPTRRNTKGNNTVVSAPGFFHSKEKKALEAEVPFTEAQTFKALYLNYLYDICLRTALIPTKLFWCISSPFITLISNHISLIPRTGGIFQCVCTRIKGYKLTDASVPDKMAN